MISSICNTQSSFCKSRTEFTSLTAVEAISELKVYTQVLDIPTQDWNSLVSSHDNFYFTPAYLSAIEACNKKDTDFRYIVVKQNGIPMLIAYCQIVAFDIRKTQKYTPDVISQGRTEKIKNFFTKNAISLLSNVKIKLLVCGNLFLSENLAIARILLCLKNKYMNCFRKH